MADLQTTVNILVKHLRVQVIERLIKEDCFKHNQPLPCDEELEYRKVAIYKLPCCTKMLKRLFADAHRMHEERGMFPHTVCVADLEWCLEHRHIGMQGNVKQSWLPAKEDVELQQLPAFVKLDAIYRRIKKALPPIDKDAVENEAKAIINETAMHITRRLA